MSACKISVVMPVFNGSLYFERSIRSLCRQTFPHWELLAVDDGSTDNSYLRLCDWSRADPRIRPFRLPRNGGPAAARNQALRQARGEIVAYLDCDDAYYPDYLSQVDAWHTAGDVLVFAYDIVEVCPATPGVEVLRAWDPALVRERLMDECIVIPLGVAHPRSLLNRVGFFQEGNGFFFEEDWDLWKRMARAGLEFIFLPLKSGRYHVRTDSLARTRRRLQADGAENSVPAKEGGGP